MHKMFVNLPVSDLQRSVEFFTRLGFSFDPRFTDENATCMLVGEDAYVMLLVEKFFKGFTRKDIGDARSITEAIFALGVGSREAVDDLLDKALAAGAGPSMEPMDEAGMYGRSFEDLDGHLWEVFFMNEAAMAAAAPQTGEAAPAQ
jgi:uncharacterized protein